MCLCPFSWWQWWRRTTSVTTYESNEARDWVESMVAGDWLSSDDSASSCEEEERPIRAVSFEVELDDDSVDDEEYYQEYARYNNESKKLNEHEVLDFLHMARQKANTYKECMTREAFADILKIYELILASCSMVYKRQMIKEYDAIRAIYPSEKPIMNAAFREYEKARNHDLGFDQQKFHYRNAIALMPSLERKREWKKEYNSFLTL
jgi:hypothetical protein